MGQLGQFTAQSIVCGLSVRLLTLERGEGIVVVTPFLPRFMVAAARCLYHATIYSAINRLPFPRPALLFFPVRPCPQFRRVG